MRVSQPTIHGTAGSGVAVASGPWAPEPLDTFLGEVQPTADDSFGRLYDDDSPARTTGRAADMSGTTQGFLRAIGEARRSSPLRSAAVRRAVLSRLLQNMSA